MKTEEKLMNSTAETEDTKSMEERNKNLVRQAAEEIYNKGNYTL